MSVGKPSSNVRSSSGITESTVVRNLVNVRNAEKLSSGTQLFSSIRDFILERNCVNVLCVADALLETHSLEFIREFILERNHINVISVARPLNANLAVHWRIHTGGKSYKCNHSDKSFTAHLASPSCSSYRRDSIEM